MTSFSQRHKWLGDWILCITICACVAGIATAAWKTDVPQRLGSKIRWKKHLDMLEKNPDIIPWQSMFIGDGAVVAYREMGKYVPSEPDHPEVKKFAETIKDAIALEPKAFDLEVASKYDTFEDFKKGEFGPESGNLRERNSKFKPTPGKKDKLSPQGGTDQNSRAMLHKALHGCHYELTVPAIGRTMGYATFVIGTKCIMPLHFLKLLTALQEEYPNWDGMVKFRNMISNRDRQVHRSEFEEGKIEDADLAHQDVVLVNFKKTFMHPDIVSFFVTEKQMAPHSRIPLAIARLTVPEGDVAGAQINYVDGKRNKSQYISSETIGDYTVKEVISYRMDTEPGDCGMLISAALIGFGPGKILGFHVAGSDSSRIGIGTIITADALRQALKKTERDYPLPLDVAAPQCCEMPAPGNFFPFQRAIKPVSQPGVSQIQESVLHNEWHESPYDRPLLMRKMVDGRMIDPIVNALTRYGQDQRPQDIPTLKIAMDFVGATIMGAALPHMDPRILTFEEAVLGIPGERFCKSIPRTTSAGYPDVLGHHPGFRGKEWYFGTGDEFDLERPQAIQLKKDCEEMLEKAKRGERSQVVYVDFLKDELRKHKRVREGNTRLISAAPMAYTIVFRMVCYSWVMALMKFNLEIGTAMGLNPYSEDWNALAVMLKSKGNNILAGDFTGFDTSHSSIGIFLVTKMMNEFYNDNFAVAREVLMMDAAQSVHIVNDIIYAWMTGGFPSGHPGTAPIASTKDISLYVAAWIKLNPLGVAGLKDFRIHVYLCVLGDDSIVSVSDWAIAFFNYHTISEVMKDFGYTYTDELKDVSSESPLCRTLEEVTFLKRSFRYDDFHGRYMAPLRIQGILESLYWTKTGALSEENSCTRVENALRELSLHSKEDFQKWAPMVLRASYDKLQYYPETRDYRALQANACRLENFY